LVLLSYACKEALKIDWKLEEEVEVEEDAMGKTSDIDCSESHGKLMGARQTDLIG